MGVVRITRKTADPFDVWAKDKAIRFYAHDTALGVVRNTFPGAHVTNLDRPLWQFRSVGSIAETNKQADWAIERILVNDYESEPFKTPTGRTYWECDFDFSTNLWTSTFDPSLITASTGFGGITIYDGTAGYGQDHIRLVQYLDDPGSWALISNLSGTVTTKAFTIPSSATDCGHVVSLKGNLSQERVNAYVDGVLYASLSTGEVPGTLAVGNILHGVTLYSGTQAGPTPTRIGLSATRIIHYGVTT